MDVVTELTELEDEVDAAEGRTRAAPQFEAFPTDTASDLSNSRHEAFRSPGIEPTWSSSDKDFVTTALDGSRLRATVGHGGCRVQIRNRNGETLHASAVVSLDFSYLVRLGLRDALDPRVQDTLRVVDHLLKVETPSGALYHRYNGDGYGEHADGRPFDGAGIAAAGRCWSVSAVTSRCRPVRIHCPIFRRWSAVRARRHVA